MYRILERDEFGNPHEVIYSNSFRVIGRFDDKGDPVYVTIKDPEGKLVYEGIIEVDIYEYFQQYLKTGKTIKSREL